jgi:hypothetical protein
MPDQVRYDEFGLFTRLSRPDYKVSFSIKLAASAASGWADS